MEENNNKDFTAVSHINRQTSEVTVSVVENEDKNVKSKQLQL